MDPDRNLLFGVISMHAGLIDAAQFVEVTRIGHLERMSR